VNSAVHNLACVIKVSGELTVVTEREFAARVDETLAESRGPVLFDLSELNYLDCCGARALTRAVRAVPSGETGLRGCNPLVRRVLDALALDLPYVRERDSKVTLRPLSRARAGTSSRGEAMAAMARAAESSARQSALYGSEVMSRLAATYSELALNSRYRTHGKSEDRGRLLMLSGRALDLSRHYMRNAASAAGDVGA
jgi:anti-anti-sigma factor